MIDPECPPKLGFTTPEDYCPECGASESELDAATNGLLQSFLGVLDRYARHLGDCKAFPATSDEQIARECSCGLAKCVESIRKRITR